MTYGIVILAVCVAVVLHSLFTLLRKRNQLGHLSGHNTFRHSVPMTLGMISTMTAGSVIGGMMETQLSTAYIIGFAVGVVLGLLIGLPFKEMAILDGMVAGVMGGLMGIMLGDMVPQTGLYAVTTCMAALLAVTWIVLLRRIHVHQLAHSTNTQNIPG
ncbi:hypothetical protein GCM10025859_24620 [Alicyclobacillus fastidiosus]|nr:hypothetical protein GCM10025859_24620 [Alicyclobacillus fastidiosus]